MNSTEATRRLARMVRDHPKMFVLTGAGCSTDSGIPDYRDREGNWKRSAPVMQQDFLRSARVRQRYWARSMIGWPVVSQSSPNAAHLALAALERSGHVTQVVTQNVDGLHQRAGSRQVVDLHGQIASVLCLECGASHARAKVQAMLEAANSDWIQCTAAAAPDGDADLSTSAIGEFRVAACPNCGGLLKPDVVFYGDTVPQARVAAAMTALEDTGAMLVVGSSLSVYSGFRFCLKANDLGIPIMAINLGRTRADNLFDLKVEHPCGEALQRLAEHLNEHPDPCAAVRQSKRR